MHDKAEGFFYPNSDVVICIHCDLCSAVCPVINSLCREKIVPEKSKNGVPELRKIVPAKDKKPPFPKHFLETPNVFAVQCESDELRLKSASGGVFTMLAENVIAAGGIVFGARWNEDFTEVFHDFTGTREGLAAFRGSKYLQSKIGNAFIKAREFLRAGTTVLFTGTPCQINGLRRFLRKDFPNLLAVDIACHSAPSPKIWRAFWKNLRERERIENPLNVLFRKKIFRKNRGWNCSEFAVETPAGTAFSEPLYSTNFGKGFGSGLFSRPSCHECPSKNRTSGSDITIGDFWGVEKYFPLKSSEGLSVVICNSDLGNAAIDAIKNRCKIFQKTSYEQAVPANGGLKNETHKNERRERFFAEFNSATTSQLAAETIAKFTKLSLRKRVKNFAIRQIRKILIATGTLNFVKKILKK